MNSVIEKVKAKYPQYADVPDDELTTRIADKYPQYLEIPDFEQDVQRIKMPGEQALLPQAERTSDLAAAQKQARLSGEKSERVLNMLGGAEFQAERLQPQRIIGTISKNIVDLPYAVGHALNSAVPPEAPRVDPESIKPFIRHAMTGATQPSVGEENTATEGVVSGSANVLAGLVSPETGLAIATGAAAPEVVAKLFVTDIAGQLPGTVDKLLSAKTPKERVEAGVELAAQAGTLKLLHSGLARAETKPGPMESLVDAEARRGMTPTPVSESTLDRLEAEAKPPETKAAEAVGPATAKAVEQTKGIENATGTQQIEKGVQSERVETDARGLPTETSVGDQLQRTEEGAAPQGSVNAPELAGGAQGETRNPVAPPNQSLEALKGRLRAITEQFNRPKTTKKQKGDLIRQAEETRKAISLAGGTATDIQEATYGKAKSAEPTQTGQRTSVEQLAPQPTPTTPAVEGQAPIAEAGSKITAPGPGGMGIVSPHTRISTELSEGLTGAANRISTGVKGMAGETLPKFTAADREAGEAGSRYLSSRIAAPYNAIMFTSRVLETGVDPRKFGAALTEDNLRSIRQDFLTAAADAKKKGQSDLAGELQAKADNVKTLHGSRNFPFKSEQEYQDFLSDPVTQEAIEAHKALWDSEIEPMYRNAQSLDPDVELPSRGLQTGARINLKALTDEEQGTHVVTAGRGSVTSTFKKKSPFARQAKGTGKRYEQDYNEIIANTYYRQLELANQNNFHRILVEKGLAKIGPKPPDDVAGEAPSKGYPLTRRLILSDGKVFAKNENLYVPKSLESEYRGASNLDEPLRLPVLKGFVSLLNKGALVSIGEFTGHSLNLADALLNSPKGKPLLDTLAKVAGRSDVPITIFQTIRKALADNKSQLAELATIGALREPFKGLGPTSKVISWLDRTVRLVLDDSYKAMAAKKMVPDTETARREFVNQVGQYNTRAQGPIIRALRDTGLAPFVTAGRAFNVLGIKRILLKPGLEPASIAASVTLKANVLGSIVGFIALRSLLNLVTSGNANGRPGTPLMNVDAGKDDKAGHHLSFPLGDLLGPGRGLRVTGLRGAIEAHRAGLNTAEMADAAMRDIISSAISPVWGPSQRFASTVISGAQTPFAPKIAPTAKASESQFGLNVGTAAKEFNPFVATAVDVMQGKGIEGRKFAGRVSPLPGKTTSQAENMRKIVDRAKTKEFKDYVVREARKLPKKDRAKFVAQQSKGANFTERDRSEIANRIRY